MRMWMINPLLLCNNHLLGEHNELHKHRHLFIKQHSIKGRITPLVQIEPANMGYRHDALVREMERRGMNHQSPYTQPDISYLPLWQQEAQVSQVISMAHLIQRCPDCTNRIMNGGIS